MVRDGVTFLVTKDAVLFFGQEDGDEKSMPTPHERLRLRQEVRIDLERILAGGAVQGDRVTVTWRSGICDIGQRLKGLMYQSFEGDKDAKARHRDIVTAGLHELPNCQRRNQASSAEGLDSRAPETSASSPFSCRDEGYRGGGPGQEAPRGTGG